MDMSAILVTIDRHFGDDGNYEFKGLAIDTGANRKSFNSQNK